MMVPSPPPVIAGIAITTFTLLGPLLTTSFALPSRGDAQAPRGDTRPRAPLEADHATTSAAATSAAAAAPRAAVLTGDEASGHDCVWEETLPKPASLADARAVKNGDVLDIFIVPHKFHTCTVKEVLIEPSTVRVKIW